MIVGAQQYDGEDFVELEAIENDPEVRAKVEATKSYPAVYCADHSNITCDVCERRISKKEWEDLHKGMPKVPIEEWTFTEEIGIVVINDYAVDKVTITIADKEI